MPVEKGWDQPERAEGEADMKDAGSMGRAQSVGPDTDGECSA